MTKQEIFDKVATHLFTQGMRSIDSEERCCYRGPNNTSCAIGCLIPDENYDKNMENECIVTLINNNKHNHSEKWNFFAIWKDKKNLLQALQSVHDYSNNWQSTVKMRKALADLAEYYNLDSSIINTLKFKNSKKNRKGL
jgi:hypothetical protein